MRIVGSVAADAVPEGERNTRDTVWRNLVRRAVADYHQGQVTHVHVESREELQKLRNGTTPYWRAQGLQCTPVVVEVEGGLDVYLELAERVVEVDGALDSLGRRPRRH